MELAYAVHAPAANSPEAPAHGQLLGAIVEVIEGFGGSAHQDMIADFISARAASEGADRQAIRDHVRTLLEGHRRQDEVIRPMFGPDSKRWMLKA